MLKKEGVQRESHPSRPEVTRRLRYTPLGLTVESSSSTSPLESTIRPSITGSMEPVYEAWPITFHTGMNIVWFQFSRD